MIRKMDPHGLADPKPWTPQILPAQLLIIGSVAIAAIPHEMTTTSGQRVEKMLQTELRPLGVETVIVAGYANAYAGYVTTPEEYAVQDYEGASTHFGKWTLPGWMTVFAELARETTTEAVPADELRALRASRRRISRADSMSRGRKTRIRAPRCRKPNYPTVGKSTSRRNTSPRFCSI